MLLQRLERFSNFKIWFRCDILLALFLNERYLKMKKSTLVVSALSALLLSGCSSMFTGTDQPVEVRTHHEEVGDKLDHVATVTVIGDAYRVKYQNVQAGEQVVLHRKNAPVVVRVEESRCIMSSEERYDAGIHPAVLLDVLATSPLSTSIDSSTGAAWRYDKTLYVAPQIKDTPECQQWLKEEVAKMQAAPESKKSDKFSELQRHGFAYDQNSVIHPQGYEEQFKPKTEEAVEEAK